MADIFTILIALAVTIIVEFILYLAIIRKKPLSLLSYSALINSLTLPIASFLYIHVISFLLLVEISVILAEVFLIRWLAAVDYKKALLISLIANIITGILSIPFLFY